MKRVLMISYVFPPYFGSSGNLRVLGFARYLPDHGWEPAILTAHPRAYSRVNDRLLEDVPEGLYVRRAFGLDVRRHLSLFGKYPAWLALPDRWASWWLGAVPAGLSMIRRFRPDVLWSTYPIPTSHLVASTLSRMTGIPWVADYRDPMNLSDAANSELARRVRQRLDHMTVRRASRVVFTTPGARRVYAERYGDVEGEKWAVIANGFDERHFSRLDIRQKDHRPAGPCRMLHSGFLYREERNPMPFFEALARLRSEGVISADRLQVRLRASGNEDFYRERLRSLGIEDMVELAESIPYDEALREMAEADILLLFQGRSCNQQIPAKLYEYVRIGKPILALADPQGDTGALVSGDELGEVLDIDDVDAIASGLVRILDDWESGRLGSVPVDRARKYSRRARAAELASLLDSLVR